MEYHLEVDSENKRVKVTVLCLLNQGLRKEILLAVANQLRANDYSRALIDVTAAIFNPDESMVGALDLTSFMHSIGISPQVKLAFVYADAEEHRKYFESVSQLDGFTLRYFTSADEAAAWLRE